MVLTEIRRCVVRALPGAVTFLWWTRPLFWVRVARVSRLGVVHGSALWLLGQLPGRLARKNTTNTPERRLFPVDKACNAQRFTATVSAALHMHSYAASVPDTTDTMYQAQGAAEAQLCRDPFTPPKLLSRGYMTLRVGYEACGAS